MYDIIKKCKDIGLEAINSKKWTLKRMEMC